MATHIETEQTVLAYKITLWITLLLSLIQLGTFSFVARSISLGGDALHSAIDCFILYGSMCIARLPRGMTKEQRAEREGWWNFVAILSLFFSAFFIGHEGWQRIHTPPPTLFNTEAVMTVAVVSLFVNYVCYRALNAVHELHHDTKHKVNIAHIAADFGMSFIVLVSAGCVALFKTPAFDGYGALAVATGLVLLGIHISSGHKH